MNLNAPPEEDSQDLTEEDIEGAVETTGLEDFSTKLKDFSYNFGSPKEYALRRRAPHLYCKVTFPPPTPGFQYGDIDKVLFFRISWLSK